MRVGRLALVVATLVAILVFPLALRDAVQALKLPSAYAAAGVTDAEGRLYQNGNNNDNDGGGNNDDDDDDDDNRNDNNDESDNEGEDNENDYTVCYESLNSNEEVPCDFEDNDNDPYYAPAPAPAPSAPAPAPMSNRSCFSAGQTGQVVLNLSGGSVVVRVVNNGLPSSAWIGLDAVNPGSVPPPPGGAMVLDSLVWNINAGSGCDGAGMGQLPGAVNLGIPYSISADKSKLQIVRLSGGQWVEVPTVPDPSPSNPYISATIQETGTYAVIQKP